MFTTKRFSNHRQLVDDLLIRSREDHAPITAALLWDVTDTVAAIATLRARGLPVGLTAYLVRATAMTLQKHRQLNCRVFRRWYGPVEVSWDEVSCNLVVARETEGGEEVLFPLVIRNADTLSVEAIHERIREAKQAPLDTVKEVGNRAKLQRMPRLALKVFSHLVRTRPAFYIGKFGTYGLSSLEHENGGGVAAVGPSPSTAFLPSNIEDRAVVRDGQIVIRKMLSISMIADHTIVDGLVALRASLHLKQLVEQPQLVLGDLLPPRAAAS